MTGYSSGSQAISRSNTCRSPSILRSPSVSRPTKGVARPYRGRSGGGRGVVREGCGPGARAVQRQEPGAPLGGVVVDGGGLVRPGRRGEGPVSRNSATPSSAMSPASAARRLQRAGRRRCAPAWCAPGRRATPRALQDDADALHTPSTRAPGRPRAACSTAARSTRRTRPAAPRARAAPARHPWPAEPRPGPRRRSRPTSAGPYPGAAPDRTASTRAGGYRRVKAGRRGNRAPEGGRPLVDQAQQGGKLKTLRHSACLSPHPSRSHPCFPGRQLRGPERLLRAPGLSSCSSTLPECGLLDDDQR
ncbi:hypothetical protein STENM36S_03361 [Streptomyces tendae]